MRSPRPAAAKRPRAARARAARCASRGAACRRTRATSPSMPAAAARASARRRNVNSRCDERAARRRRAGSMTAAALDEAGDERARHGARASDGAGGTPPLGPPARASGEGAARACRPPALRRRSRALDGARAASVGGEATGEVRRRCACRRRRRARGQRARDGLLGRTWPPRSRAPTDVERARRVRRRRIHSRPAARSPHMPQARAARSCARAHPARRPPQIVVDKIAEPLRARRRARRAPRRPRRALSRCCRLRRAARARARIAARQRAARLARIAAAFSGSEVLKAVHLAREGRLRDRSRER